MRWSPTVGMLMGSLLAISIVVQAQEPAAAEKKETPASATASADVKVPAAKPQTTCPVTGSKIDKANFVDVGCWRIYVCCKDCIDKIKAEPQKFMDKITANGEQPECRPDLCPKCGEGKGSDKCCKEGSEKCADCGKAKGAPGCCKSVPSCPAGYKSCCGGAAASATTPAGAGAGTAK